MQHISEMWSGQQRNNRNGRRRRQSRVPSVSTDDVTSAFARDTPFPAHEQTMSLGPYMGHQPSPAPYFERGAPPPPPASLPQTHFFGNPHTYVGQPSAPQPFPGPRPSQPAAHREPQRGRRASKWTQQRGGRPNNVSTKSTFLAPSDSQPCRNCGRTGHQAWDCIKAGPDGFMARVTCPLCNADNHYYANCWERRRLDDDARRKMDYRLNVDHRANRCPAKTGLSWYHIWVAAGSPAVPLPHTPGFVLDQSRRRAYPDWKTFEYTGILTVDELSLAPDQFRFRIPSRRPRRFRSRSPRHKQEQTGIKRERSPMRLIG
ncbi:hypothetical protein F5B20DRAFT_548944 [Whalleya microplaca]|nr:hypothetical protein F5B20DRAFT_548944 [Whalleya microplaca]